jgi:hypothetical protein
MLTRLYLLDQPASPLTPEGFRLNLERESVNTLNEDAVKHSLEIFSKVDSERSELDIVIYLTLAASIEHALSVDGQERNHVERALFLARQALSREKQAEKEAQEGRLPMLFSYRNAYGVAIENLALISDSQNLEEKVTPLEDAYESFAQSAQGPLFCRQRATNNQIDLEMKSLSLNAEVRERLRHGKSSLAREVGTALTNPQLWERNKLHQLNDLENYLSIPEISLTELQVISVFASEQRRREGAAFCGSEDFLKAYQLGESALRKSLILGFRDCSFFRDADTSHIPLFTICPNPPGQQSLCSTLHSFIPSKEFTACTLCSSNF